MGVATGRLFRSLHSDGQTAPDAIVALDLDDVIRLRTVSLSLQVPPDASAGTAASAAPETDPDFAHLFADPIAAEAVMEGELADDDGAFGGSDTGERFFAHHDRNNGDDAGEYFVDDDEFDGDHPVTDRSPDARATDRAAGRTVRSRHGAELNQGISAWIAVAMILGVTTIIGTADVFVTGQLGWLTGIALVLGSAYAAATVRPHDGYWVVVTPSLAFLLTTVTVGQLTVTGGGFWVRQGLLIPFTLGRAAVWIIVATALAALIVGIRRRRALRR